MSLYRKNCKRKILTFWQKKITSVKIWKNKLRIKMWLIWIWIRLRLWLQNWILKKKIDLFLLMIWIGVLLRLHIAKDKVLLTNKVLIKKEFQLNLEELIFLLHKNQMDLYIISQMVLLKKVLMPKELSDLAKKDSILIIWSTKTHLDQYIYTINQISFINKN